MNPRAKFRSLYFADLPALPRAVWELARARVALHRLEAAAIPVLNERARKSGTQGVSHGEIVERVSRIIPAAAGRVPWRSDCLVQAIAAQAMLAAAGVAGRIVLGVDRAQAGIEPHAWLMAGDAVVTGGPVERYTVLLGGGAA